MTFFIQSYFVKEALEKFKVVFRDKVPVIEKRSDLKMNTKFLVKIKEDFRYLHVRMNKMLLLSKYL